MIEKKIGFIGFGNMAQGIARGFINSDIICGNNIFASDIDMQKLIIDTEKMGVRQVPTNEELINAVDIVIIAIKPFLVEKVILPLVELLKNKVVVSIVAGIYYENYEEILLRGTHHLTIMPNMPISVGEGLVLFENKHTLSDDEYVSVRELFSLCAMVIDMEAEKFGISGTISACGPAFVSLFVEAVADGAVERGLGREEAYLIAEKMILGTAKLLLDTSMHPGVLKDSICSPKGTTIKGVNELERNGFRSAIIDAVLAIKGM